MHGLQVGHALLALLLAVGLPFNFIVVGNSLLSFVGRDALPLQH